MFPATYAQVGQFLVCTSKNWDDQCSSSILVWDLMPSWKIPLEVTSCTQQRLFHVHPEVPPLTSVGILETYCMEGTIVPTFISHYRAVWTPCSVTSDTGGKGWFTEPVNCE